MDSTTTIACSACFADRGLSLDAYQLGLENDQVCPNCGRTDGKKLGRDGLAKLAFRFFVWGSFWRTEYGGAPLVQFNEHQKTSISPPSWLMEDVALFENKLNIGFFRYGPRLWMVGEVEPLKALEANVSRSSIIDRILREYPERFIDQNKTFYRLRKDPDSPDQHAEYDSPPAEFLGNGRLDSNLLPVLYTSPDLEVCVHECRVTAEDELYLATLSPSRSIRVLDLSVVLNESDGVTEFDSLDMAVHMLFMAGKHSYEISQSIAIAAQQAGFDGLIYPSYFSLLRLGVMPLRTSYGLSHRRIPELRPQEEAFSIPNLAIFGRPIHSGLVNVRCINKLVLNRIAYEFHFGPVSF